MRENSKAHVLSILRTLNPLAFRYSSFSLALNRLWCPQWWVESISMQRFNFGTKKSITNEDIGNCSLYLTFSSSKNSLKAISCSKGFFVNTLLRDLDIFARISGFFAGFLLIIRSLWSLILSSVSFLRPYAQCLSPLFLVSLTDSRCDLTGSESRLAICPIPSRVIPHCLDNSDTDIFCFQWSSSIISLNGIPKNNSTSDCFMVATMMRGAA